MKKILFTMVCAGLLCVACHKDEENTLTKNASGLNEAEYFLGNFMNVDSDGNMINRFLGEPVVGDTTVVSIRVKNVDEADKIAYSLLPDSVAIKGDKTSWQYDLKDTLNKTQASLQYAHESESCLASISVSGDCSKYVSKIQFIDSNGENTEEHHFGDTKTIDIKNYGPALFTCISNSAPYYFVHVSNTKYSMEAHDKMHYAQMKYAANLATMKNLANALANEMNEKIGAPTELVFPLQYIKRWNVDEAQNVYRLYATILGEYEGQSTFSIANPLTNIGGILEQYIEYEYKTPEFWTMYNNHDYPYSSITVGLRSYGFSANSSQEAANTTPKHEGVGSVDESYHWSYASPCDGHQFLFVVVEN